MSTHNCVNCRLNFYEESEYKDHYKSEHHRYNVKRRLIGLTPLDYTDYVRQFENQFSSKSSTQKQLHCELCSKKFLSPQTYKQHLNSQKHKNNRKKIRTPLKSADDKSQTSSCSEFSVIGESSKQKCLFCNEKLNKQHMMKEHNFPPFSSECVNLDGLIEAVRSQIKEGKCLICDQVFQCQDSAKQHMIDVGHSQLDLNKFGKYEKFYLWKIEEDSSEDEFQKLKERIQEENFQVIEKATLASLEQKRRQRITQTNIGYRINGKEVGARCLKAYYKQYLGRQIPENPFRAQLAIENSSQWKQNYKPKQLGPSRIGKISHPTIKSR